MTRARLLAPALGLTLAASGTIPASASAQQPIGSAFTYQGRLTDAGSPATGSYDFEMRLFDADTNGAQVGPTVVVEDVSVAAGAFSVQLDFGVAPFGQQRRWLQMAVRPGASTSTFTALSPRQELTPTPTALVATRANTVADGAIGVAAIDAAAVQVRVTGQCAPGSSIRQVNADGSVVCQSDGLGGGTVSAVTAGAGLTGGTITTTGSIGIAPGGVTTSMIAPGAIGLAQIDQTQVQARIAAACPDGQFLRAIAADGASQCSPLPSMPKISVVTSSEGRVAAIVGGATQTWVANAGASTWHPAVARCLNATCQGVRAVFAADGGGQLSGRPQHFSLALTGTGLPMVAHNVGVSNGALPEGSGFFLDRCLDAACTIVDRDPIHTSNTRAPGLFSALVEGTDGIPVVLYSLHDGTAQDVFIGLRLARCNTGTCNAVTVQAVPPVGVARSEFALVVSGGVPVGAFIDNSSLSVLSCATATCATVVVGPIPSTSSARYPSMAVGGDGRPLIAYGSDGGLMLARCTDSRCGKADLPVVLDATATGPEVLSAIAVASDGRPSIAYLTGTSIALVRCGNATCTSGNVRTIVDAAWTDPIDGGLTGIVRSRPGLVLINDLPVMTYPDIASGNVKTASCSTATCS